MNKLGLEERGEADMSTHAHCLADMDALLKALVDLNVVDAQTENSAKRYFDLQDRGWPQAATPKPSQLVFVDGLALVYMQHTGLLPIFLQTFPEVFIHVSTEEEANVLIEHDQNVNEVLRVIDEIRNAVRHAHAADRVVFGPRRADPSENDIDGMQSTLNLLSNLAGAETVVFDDRAVNKEPFVADGVSQRAQMATTLDLLEELRVRGILTLDQYRHHRFRLRTAGAMLIPVNADEIVAAAMRNRRNEAPEFRAIRDGLDLPRLSEMPQFPSEMRWFMTYLQEVKAAVMHVWNAESDEERARQLASEIFDLRVIPEDWVGRWIGQPPPNWMMAVRRAIIGGFALPVDIADRDKTIRYQNWFEETLMDEVRTLAPDTYQEVIGYLRHFILSPWDDDGED